MSMKEKLLILIDRKGPVSKKLTDYISQKLGTNADAELATFKDLYFSFDQKKLTVTVNGVDINKYKLVYIRRADHSLFSISGTLAVCLDYLGIKYFDTRFRRIGAAGDKMTALVRLFAAGVPVIPTSFTLAEDKIDMQTPFVCKEINTQHAKGIYVIRKKEDLEKLPRLNESGRKLRYIHQKMIDIEKEYRLLVMGDKVVSAQRMYRDLGGFSAEIDYNRPEEFVDLDKIDEEMKYLAIKAAGVLNIQIAGADVAVEKGTGKPWVLEVNRGPGFTYDTEVSPEIPELAKFLASELNN